MPVNIPNTTATAAYQYFGTDQAGNGGIFSNGYIFVANGLVDVLLFHGVHGSQQPVGPFTISTGLTPLAAGFHPGGGQIKDPIGGIGVRAQNATLSSPPQQFFGALFEPGIAALETGSPFTGTLNASGSISPGVSSLAFQHNDVLVANEPAADFEDSATVTWALTDDPVNTRMKLSAAVVLPSVVVGFDSIVAPVSITGTTQATATTIIACAAHTFDGNGVFLDVFFPAFEPGTQVGSGVFVELFEGATALGHLGNVTPGDVNQPAAPLRLAYLFTPTAGSHTYAIKAWNTGTGTPLAVAGGGGAGNYLPGFALFLKSLF